MAYCRGRVYILQHDDGRYVCMGCEIEGQKNRRAAVDTMYFQLIRREFEKEDPDFWCDTPQEMADHAEEHRAAFLKEAELAGNAAARLREEVTTKGEE